MADDLDIRRPELLGVRRAGTVRWYKDEKGYGRITADDGEVLFVHFSDVEGDGYKALNPSASRSSGTATFETHRRHAAARVRRQPPAA